jgi:cytochrome b6-f complex subunit 5
MASLKSLKRVVNELETFFYSIYFYHINFNSISFEKKNLIDINFKSLDLFMVEPLLSGIVLGLVPVTLAGLFVTAYLQYRRGDRVTSSL